MPSPVQALKLIDCVWWQSVDPPSWLRSQAKAILEAARAVCTQALPGYEQAPWEWTIHHDTSS